MANNPSKLFLLLSVTWKKAYEKYAQVKKQLCRY
jgi:hypothetical protein